MDRWIDHAVWWQVYPLGFVGAEPRALPADAAPVPRLDRLEPWLDYLVDLGCNGLALGPVFASGTHGYDTVDHHLRIDPRLGADAAFDRLVQSCAPAAFACCWTACSTTSGETPRLREAEAEGLDYVGVGTRPASGRQSRSSPARSADRAGSPPRAGNRGASNVPDPERSVDGSALPADRRRYPGSDHLRHPQAR
jgi:hypothetical protein